MTTTKPIPTGRILLKNVRLSFPSLWKPVAFTGDEPKFKATFLVPADDPQHKLIEAKILAVLKEKQTKPGQAEKTLAGIRNNPNKFCYQDGDTKDYDGWEGMFALSAKAPAGTPPTVVDRNRSPLTESSGRPYAGCYVNASVDLFVYDSSGIGVSAQVRGVQFFADGDAFSGGRPADADEFEDVTDGADAEDFA